MTILRVPTIPSEFIRLDSTVSDADAPVNVRDEQVKRENYNILLARRVRHPLVTQVFRGTDWTTDGQTFKHYDYSVNLPDRSIDALPLTGHIGSWRVRVPPFCREFTLRMRAKMDTASGDAEVFPVGVIGNPLNYSFTVTGASYAEYEQDIVVSDGTRHGFDHTIGLMYSCDSYGSALGDGIAVAWAENVSIIPSKAYVVGVSTIAATASVGDMLYFTSPANTIQPRCIVAIESITVDATTYERIWVDKPWDVLPEAGDTYKSFAVAGMMVQTICINPKATTDFAETSQVV